MAVNTAYKGRGDEARVNWATLEIVPLLLESVAGFASRHTLVFVAFSGEKGKYSGATFYLDQLSKDQQRKIDAVIELDHLGRTAPSYAPQSNAYVLGKRLRLAAFTLQFEIPQIFFTRMEVFSAAGQLRTLLRKLRSRQSPSILKTTMTCRKML